MSEVTNQLQAEKPAVSQEKLDVLDQLLKPEVQESITALVNELPKLTEMMTTLTKIYDLAQSLSTDEVLKNDIVGAVGEIATPVVNSAKNLAATAIEAKDRAEESTETIGLFGMLRLLKEPQVQQLFRFANAFLQVNEEHKNLK
ncbi:MULTISPECIES: DUF1641 domain-containing protein [unclassified Rummeliibacillus]|uniref:DUF1641 domain-containing protein n=1 Tax=unclassified Rummeliibacillus TaxID=2622809 RepID=UPI000E66D378|nr:MULTISPECIES: DUF1641 domain-containing protein [unclassified Rummeliibacillus]RIJ66903.1 DUF1641 domain-containing protein [Rummeliibacillus sp. POC4]RPJ95312.1 DUF1641 domain-containing protein [Rummeliibacillus sp. TYF005]